MSARPGLTQALTDALAYVKTLSPEEALGEVKHLSAFMRELLLDGQNDGARIVAPVMVGMIDGLADQIGTRIGVVAPTHGPGHPFHSCDALVAIFDVPNAKASQ